jgi:DUF1365 family protein
MIDQSSLCFGKVHHVRKVPREHRFTYSMFMPFLNLDDLPKLSKLSALLRLNRFGVYSFYETDYLSEHVKENESLKQRAIRLFRKNVVEYADPSKIEESRIQVMLLAQWRFMGRTFNPISVLYFFVDHKLVFIMSEVSNTPWNEKYIYGQQLQHVGARESWVTKKLFHVSPFNSMDMLYNWTSEIQDDEVFFKLALTEKNTAIFDASFRYKRLPFTTKQFYLGILQQPFLSLHSVLGIYWQAFKLALKRTPFYSHPKYNK